MKPAMIGNSGVDIFPTDDVSKIRRNCDSSIVATTDVATRVIVKGSVNFLGLSNPNSLGFASA